VGYNVGDKVQLQALADATGLEIHVSQYPPGTSQWNPIEHKVFSAISINWRSKPLDSFDTVVQHIAHTTNATGLKIKAGLDARTYDIGRKVSKSALAKVNIERNAFQGQWNYIIRWRRAPSETALGGTSLHSATIQSPDLQGLAEGSLLSRSRAELFDASA